MTDDFLPHSGNLSSGFNGLSFCPNIVQSLPISATPIIPGSFSIAGLFCNSSTGHDWFEAEVHPAMRPKKYKITCVAEVHKVKFQF